jgi:hypothetical protein
MFKTLKTRSIRERVRRKYTRIHNPSEAQVYETRFNLGTKQRSNRLMDARKRQQEQAKQKFLAKIKQEKHPDKLREQIELAKKHYQEERLQEENKRLKKMEQAKERLKEVIKKMNSREASATTKEAVQDIQAGRGEVAIKNLKDAGYDGSLGNKTADNSSAFAREAKVLAKETGKHFNSILCKILKENSVPADTIKAQVRQDKGDQNLEGSQTKESTVNQMIQQKIRDHKTH